MPRVVVNTTFRDFTGDINDEMQIKFLKSLRRQTFQDYILVVSVFYEKRVETVVRSILGDRCTFIYDACEGNYRFSLSKTFKNGIDLVYRMVQTFYWTVHRISYCRRIFWK